MAVCLAMMAQTTSMELMVDLTANLTADLADDTTGNDEGRIVTACRAGYSSARNGWAMTLLVRQDVSGRPGRAFGEVAGEAG